MLSPELGLSSVIIGVRIVKDESFEFLGDIIFILDLGFLPLPTEIEEILAALVEMRGLHIMVLLLIDNPFLLNFLITAIIQHKIHQFEIAVNDTRFLFGFNQR